MCLHEFNFKLRFMAFFWIQKVLSRLYLLKAYDPQITIEYLM